VRGRPQRPWVGKDHSGTFAAAVDPASTINVRSLPEGWVTVKRLLAIAVMALVAIPGLARADSAVRVADPDDVTSRRRMDIKVATSQVADFGGPATDGIFVVEAYEPITQSDFLDASERSRATLEVIIRYEESHPGNDIVFRFVWDEEFDANSWHSTNFVTGETAHGNMFQPTDHTLQFSYPAGTIPDDDGFDWAVRYVRLDTGTGARRGVIDRAPDVGFSGQAGG